MRAKQSSRVRPTSARQLRSLRRRAALAGLALTAAGLPLVAATTAGLTRASAAPVPVPAPAWTAYVADFGTNNFTPINTATKTPGSNIALPTGASGPEASAVTPDGKTAYMANVESNNVTPIDTATNTPGSNIGLPGASGSAAIAVTPDGKTAYVANGNSNNVTPIDTATNTAGSNIALPTGASAPQAIAVTPDGKTAYVANGGSNNVTPIDTATNAAGSNIALPTGASAPEAIAITPDGKTAYVANNLSSNVTPIDTATNAAGSNIALPTGATSPQAIAVTPDGKTAYATDHTSNNVTPIDTATNAAGSNIALPTGATLPAGIAITPDQAPVARLSVTPAHAGAPSSFDASASTVRFGSIASYAWNFGDGSSATTTSPTTTHAYASAGTFTATVTESSSGGTSTTQVFTGQTVSKNGGPSAVDSVPVTVPATAPPGAGVATSAQFGVPNQTDLFDVNNNGAVEVRWVQAGGPWNGPLGISPPGVAPPGAHVRASAQFGIGNQTDVFVVGGDGATRVLWVQGTGAWHGPLSITPTGTAPVGAALATSNQFGIGNQTDVFVVGGDGATRVSWVAGAGVWQGPLTITPPTTAPAGAGLAASTQFGVPNQTDVFVVAATGATQVSWVQGAGTWKGPLPITPTATAPPGAALAASPQFGVPNQTDVFVVDNFGATRVSWVQSAGTWKGPLAITLAGNAPKGGRLAASNQFGIPNQTDLFDVGNSGSTQVSWVQSGAWQGPLPI